LAQVLLLRKVCSWRRRGSGEARFCSLVKTHDALAREIGGVQSPVGSGSRLNAGLGAGVAAAQSVQLAEGRLR
jgi:hypothetical protein